MYLKNKHYRYVLFIIYIITSISVISCNHDKQSDVASCANWACDDLIFEYETDINRLNKYLIPDTIEVEDKKHFYRQLKRDGVAIEDKFSFISLLTCLYTNDKNKQEVWKINDELKDKISGLCEFYFNHPDYGDLQTGDLDTLTSYYNSLVSNIKRLQKIKIEL